MVGLVNKFAAKMEEKKGALSEDEVRRNALFSLMQFDSKQTHRPFNSNPTCSAWA